MMFWKRRSRRQNGEDPLAGDVLGEMVVSSRSRVRAAGNWLPLARLRILFWISASVIGVLILRSAFLQISNNSAFRTQAEENRVRLLVEYAPRGVFFDRHGRQLVQNIPSTEVVIYPAELPADTEALIAELRSVLPDISAVELRDLLSGIDRTSPRPVPLRSNISHEQQVAILAKEAQLPGVRVENHAVRSYQNNTMFAHILGYTGRITKEEKEIHPDYLPTEFLGKSGIEFSYEKLLRGTHGARRVEVDAAGNAQSDLGTNPAQPGANLRLHLDADLQERVSAALSEALRKAGVRRGAAVALDPRTGAVRALVSLPAYDHTALARGLTSAEAAALFGSADQPLLDRVIQGRYPPGSTFKISVAAGGLEEGVITPATTVESTGGIRVGQWFFPDWKAGGHGTTNLQKAIAESVNTFFYMLGGGFNEGQGLGIRRMTKWAERMGFGGPTGIDLPGEVSGFMPSPEWKEEVKKEAWYIGDTYHAAIGQGDVLVTPLQLAVVTATIANGGTVIEPRIVDATVRNDGSVIEEFPPKVRRSNAIHPETASALRGAMREAVVSGSARALANLPVAIAGKTGTAQTGGTEKTHAWFTSFAPAENPELVLVVLVEQGGGGDLTAVPVARSVLEWYFTRLRPNS